MTIIAQVSPPANEIKAALELVLYFCGIILAVAGVWALVRKPTSKTELAGQPIEVKEHRGSVSRDELEKVDTMLHGRLKRERLEINEEIRRVEEAAAKRADAIEGNLLENTKMTSEMRGEVRQLNQSMHQFNTTLTQFLQQQANNK